MEDRKKVNNVCVVLVNKPALLPQLAEACFRFSPQVALRTNEAIFLEIGKCRSLFSSEDSLAMRIAAVAKRFGLVVKIYFAPNPAEALAMTRFGWGDIKTFPLEALYDFANPFVFDQDLAKKVGDLISLLRMLGVRNLKEFIKIPPRQLASRFGSLGVDLSHRIQKSFNQTLVFSWPIFQVPQKIVEKIELDDFSQFAPCAELEPLSFVLKHLSDRAMSRLRARSERALSVQLELRLSESVDSRSWVIELAVPQGSTSGLLPLLKEKLSAEFATRPLSSAVVGVCFRVLESAPGHGAQKDLFSNKEEQAEEQDALIARLCQKLGKDQVFFAQTTEQYLPEDSWKAVLEIKDQTLTATFPPRPARLLKAPELLKKQDGSLVRCAFRKNLSNRWRILEWHGPERIKVNWWRGPNTANRDYYRVVSESGEQLWVFTTPEQQNYFYLHGYFD